MNTLKHASACACGVLLACGGIAEVHVELDTHQDGEIVDSQQSASGDALVSGDGDGGAMDSRDASNGPLSIDAWSDWPCTPDPRRKGQWRPVALVDLDNSAAVQLCGSLDTAGSAGATILPVRGGAFLWLASVAKHQVRFLAPSGATLSSRQRPSVCNLGIAGTCCVPMTVAEQRLSAKSDPVLAFDLANPYDGGVDVMPAGDLLALIPPDLASAQPGFLVAFDSGLDPISSVAVVGHPIAGALGEDRWVVKRTIPEEPNTAHFDVYSRDLEQIGSVDAPLDPTAAALMTSICGQDPACRRGFEVAGSDDSHVFWWLTAGAFDLDFVIFRSDLASGTTSVLFHEPRLVLSGQLAGEQVYYPSLYAVSDHLKHGVALLAGPSGFELWGSLVPEQWRLDLSTGLQTGTLRSDPHSVDFGAGQGASGSHSIQVPGTRLSLSLRSSLDPGLAFDVRISCQLL